MRSCEVRVHDSPISQGGSAMPANVHLDIPEASTALQVVKQEDGTRAQLLRRAIIGGGAVLGGAAMWAVPQLTVAAPSGEQDKRVLNLVLAVEYVESAFYQEALARAGLKGDLKEFARIVAEGEPTYACRGGVGRRGSVRSGRDRGTAGRRVGRAGGATPCVAAPAKAGPSRAGSARPR
jgi:hypothetical protein